jgi:hypothetical protein
MSNLRPCLYNNKTLQTYLSRSILRKIRIDKAVMFLLEKDIYIKTVLHRWKEYKILDLTREDKNVFTSVNNYGYYRII